MTPRSLFEKYASGIAYVEVKLPTGDYSMGTAFHVGDGVFITARHVVESNEILSIGTTVSQYVPDPNGFVTINGKEGKFRSIFASEGIIKSGPYYHPDPSVDVAALIVEGLECPIIPLGGHLDDWIKNDDFILQEVVIMGYPPIPFSKEPLLVVARAEINAVVDKYTGGHPHFVISAMARGGFSGGPCLIEGDATMGVITESLIRNNNPTELGYMAVLTVEPIFVCLHHNHIMPLEYKKGWDGLWDDIS